MKYASFLIDKRRALNRLRRTRPALADPASSFQCERPLGRRFPRSVQLAFMHRRARWAPYPPEGAIHETPCPCFDDRRRRGRRHAETYIDNARVSGSIRSTKPSRVPRQECTSQWVNEAQPAAGPHNYGGALLGGVAGALLGNQVGSGHGKRSRHGAWAPWWAPSPAITCANGNAPAATRTVPREVQSCRTVNEQQTASPAIASTTSTAASTTRP